MRYVLLLLALPALLATGCSSYITQSGRYPFGFNGREGLHAELGPPISTSTTKAGAVVEEFRSRQKFYEELGESSLYWMAVGTFGLSEVIVFPYQVALQVKRVAFGQRLRYEFAPDGTVSLSIDGRAGGEGHELRKLTPAEESPTK